MGALSDRAKPRARGRNCPIARELPHVGYDNLRVSDLIRPAIFTAPTTSDTVEP